jgi:uncharacterized protein (TIGR03437 family)
VKLSTSDGLAFTDLISAGSLTLNVTSGSVNASSSVTLPTGGTEPYTVKSGPLITRVLPAAAAEFPLVLAPRMLISIYGTDLAGQATADQTTSDQNTSDQNTKVLVGASAIQLSDVTPTQINAVLPDSVSGLTQLTVQDSAGQQTLNVYVEAAAPAIFTQNSSGSGPASALKASNGTLSLVTADNPLNAGDTVALYVTGLGLTKPGSGPDSGLDVAVQQPTVSIAQLNCPVTFAGAAPGFIGLDQINCTIPAGIAATASAPVVVISGDRISNTATLAIN